MPATVKRENNSAIAMEISLFLSHAVYVPGSIEYFKFFTFSQLPE